jgi:hypothetical protein
MEAMFVNNDALFINNSGRLAILERLPEAKRRRSQKKFPAFFFASFFENSKPDFPVKPVIINHLNHFSPKVQKNSNVMVTLKSGETGSQKPPFFDKTINPPEWMTNELRSSSFGTVGRVQ